jgi:hypothetical protein
LTAARPACYSFIEFCFFKATPGVVLGGTWALITPPPDPPLSRPAGEGRGNWGDFAAGGLAARRKIPSCYYSKANLNKFTAENAESAEVFKDFSLRPLRSSQFHPNRRERKERRGFYRFFFASLAFSQFHPITEGAKSAEFQSSEFIGN